MWILVTATRCRAMLSCRFPDRVDRSCTAVSPDPCGMGATSMCRANAASLLNRSGLSVQYGRRLSLAAEFGLVPLSLSGVLGHHTNGEEVEYRDLVEKYRTMAISLGFEGHIAWAAAMT
jgi:hypothetical protein